MNRRRKITRQKPMFESDEDEVQSYQDMVAGFKSFQDMTRGDDMAGGIWEADTKAIVDAMTLKAMFFSEDWVYITTDLIAGIISNQPLKVVKKQMIDGQKVEEDLPGHPLLQRFESPNNYQDYHAWMYCTTVDHTILGNAVIWAPKMSNQLLTIPGESISIRFDRAGKIERYIASQYTTEDGYLADDKSIASFVKEEIIHIRRPNPSSLMWGLSPFVPGSKSVLFNRYSSEYLNSFYLKGATPGLALEMDKDANEKVILRLMRSFEAAHTGRRNQRRPMMLPKGVTVKQVATSLGDQHLTEHVNQNRETIMNLLRVPKHALSLQAAAGLGSEEHRQAMRNLWAMAIKPIMSMISGSLTKHFAGELGPGLQVDFDLSNVEILQDDESAKADLATKMLTTHTLNEVRKKVYKMEPLQGGDTTPGTQQAQGEGFGFPFGLSSVAQQTASIQTQPVLQQSAAPVTATDSSEAVDDDKSKAPNKLKADKEKLSVWLKGKDDWWNKREQTIAAGAKKAIADVERFMLETFSDMASTIISTSSKYLKAKGFFVVETKATEAGNPQVTLVKKAELRRRLRAALERMEEKWVDSYKKKLKETVELGYDAAMNIPFGMPSKDEIQALKERSESLREEALEEHAQRAFKYLNETTLEDVFWTIEQSIKKGKDLDGIANDLREKFSNVEQIGARAMTIARTESMIAVSLGQAASMKDAATVVPNLKKMWLTANDDRVRDSHEALNGDVVDWDQAFDNGLFFPRDPQGEAGDIINCRCTWVTLPADQMESLVEENPDLEADEV
jgi:HK97 family phage portal protein